MMDERQAIDEYRSEVPAPQWKTPFGVKYTPTPQQLEAHLSDRLVRVLAGGYGSGKTTCLLVEILKQIENHGARHIAVICDNSVQCQRMIDGLYELFRSECGKYLFSRSLFRVELGFPVNSDEQTVTFERASVVFSAYPRDLWGQVFDFAAIQTSNGDIGGFTIHLPKTKRVMVDFNPGKRLEVGFMGDNVEIFSMAPNQSLVKMLGTWECLCCENPPAVDVPGRAAIEETIRQAKARELGDAASDPFEMENHEAER